MSDEKGSPNTDADTAFIIAANEALLAKAKEAAATGDAEGAQALAKQVQDRLAWTVSRAVNASNSEPKK